MEASYAQIVANHLNVRLCRVFDEVEVFVIVDANDIAAVQASVFHRRSILGATFIVNESDIKMMRDSEGYCQVLAELASRKLVNLVMEQEL